MRIIVTGGNSGVGKSTAAALAAAGHSVVIACRNLPKAERAAAEMAGDVEVRHLDLADLASVRRFADRWAGPTGRRNSPSKTPGSKPVERGSDFWCEVRDRVHRFEAINKAARQRRFSAHFRS